MQRVPRSRAPLKKYGARPLRSGEICMPSGPVRSRPVQVSGLSAETSSHATAPGGGHVERPGPSTIARTSTSTDGPPAAVVRNDGSRARPAHGVTGTLKNRRIPQAATGPDGTFDRRSGRLPDRIWNTFYARRPEEDRRATRLSHRLLVGRPAGRRPPKRSPQCERLGFDSIWTAEAYGSDCLTPLAWWGAATSRVRLGTNIMQMSARTPAAAAMAAMTLDHLSGGRFVLGLGASGPQVVEGWYGQPYPKPLARTREYIEIIRKILARDAPVTYDGEFYPLPYPGGSGLGKPLKSTVHPLRSDIPIMLGAEGPKNVALAAEIADGWLPMFFSPKMDGFYRDAARRGFRPARRAAHRGGLRGARLRARSSCTTTSSRRPTWSGPSIALYIGGMGATSDELPRQPLRPAGLRGRGREDPGAVPERAQDRGRWAQCRRASSRTSRWSGRPRRSATSSQLWESTVITSLIIQAPAAEPGRGGRAAVLTVRVPSRAPTACPGPGST